MKKSGTTSFESLRKEYHAKIWGRILGYRPGAKGWTVALNLIRNRKRKVPPIVVVTMEPLPTRPASIAMGTGDIDCAYDGALYELVIAADEVGNGDQTDMLRTLVSGRRLRDISDLPFDLAL